MMSHMLQPMCKNVFAIQDPDTKEIFTVIRLWTRLHEKHHLDILGFGSFGDNGLIGYDDLIEIVVFEFVEVFGPVKIDPSFTKDVNGGGLGVIVDGSRVDVGSTI